MERNCLTIELRLQPVVTQDRYEAVRAVSDRHMMEVRWTTPHTVQRSYLSELLDIAAGTGRRLSAICQLRFEDLRLREGPHGQIRWPASTAKNGIETVAPITPEVRAALDRIIRERPGIGSIPLFPSPSDRTKPMSRHLADKWLREAERLADVPPLKGGLWHPYRRAFATEHAHLPNALVKQLGGWKSDAALARYQKPNAQMLYDALVDRRELREVKQG
jgi:integrase